MLGRDGAYALASGMLYVEDVQVVLLYGSDMLVMYPCIRRNLGGFNHRVGHILTGRQTNMGLDGRWVYPPLAGEMSAEETSAYKLELPWQREMLIPEFYYNSRFLEYLVSALFTIRT